MRFFRFGLRIIGRMHRQTSFANFEKIWTRIHDLWKSSLTLECAKHTTNLRYVQVGLL